MTKTQWSAPASRVVTSAIPAGAEHLRITELYYHPYQALTQFGEPDVDEDQFEYIEVQNVGQQTIDLSGVRFVEIGQGNDRQGVSFEFAPQLLAPGAYLTVVHDVSAFASRFGTDIPIAKSNRPNGMDLLAA